MNTFIEANRGFEFGLNWRVPVDVIMGERLLYHQQVETIECLETTQSIRIVPIPAVSIDHQRDVTKSISYRLNDRDVPSRLNL